MGNSVVPFPGYEELQGAVDKLRTELSMLHLEHDELLYVECKHIEAAYMMALGGLEYRIYETECDILRLKRKAELIRAKKNRQEKVVLPEIEECLDIEFAEYREKLNEQIEKMNAALEWRRGVPLSREETRELKKLYRSVVRSLHPDINPEQSEAKRMLFHNAVTAYQNGDLDGLRAIRAMVGGSTLVEGQGDPLGRLVKEKERLSKLVEGIREKIAAVKLEYPYTMKSLLLDSEKVEARQAALESRIAELKLALAAYREKIEEMLG